MCYSKKTVISSDLILWTQLCVNQLVCLVQLQYGKAKIVCTTEQLLQEMRAA